MKKKILLFSVITFIGLNICKAQSDHDKFTLQIKAGLNFVQKLTGASESENPKIGFNAGIDAIFTLEKIKPIMFGLGVNPYVPRMVNDAYAWDEGTFGFIPLYVIAGIYHNINDKLRIYVPAKFGFSFFYASDDFTNLGRYGGLFMEFGIGLKYRFLSAEIGYTIINSVIDGRERDVFNSTWYTRRSELKYRAINFTLGVSF